MPYEAKKEEPLKDSDLMPSGKHKGTKMIDIPAKYLIFIYESGMCNRRVHAYIKDNLQAITKEAEKQGYDE